MFKSYYRRRFAELIDSPLTEADGLGNEVVARALADRRLTIPRALVDYYAVAGRHWINDQHNRLYPIADLDWQDGRLVFMEENQGVAIWGIPERDVNRPNPVVWQASNAELLEWFAEDYRLSQFLMAMWHWQITGVQELQDLEPDET